MTVLAMPSRPSNVWWLFLLQGVAGIILGLMLVTDPGATLVALVTFLGFYWLFLGILALVRVFVDRSVPWIWSLLTGILGLLAAVIQHWRILQHIKFENFQYTGFRPVVMITAILLLLIGLFAFISILLRL